MAAEFQSYKEPPMNIQKTVCLWICNMSPDKSAHEQANDKPTKELMNMQNTSSKRTEKTVKYVYSSTQFKHT